MRKWIIALVALLVLFVIAVYIFIPSMLVVNKYTLIGAQPQVAYRMMTDAGATQKWWADSGNTATAPGTNRQLVHDDFSFRFVPRQNEVVAVEIQHHQQKLESFIRLLPLQSDSAVIEWQATIPTSKNIVTRLRQYAAARQLKNSMTNVMQEFQAYVGQHRKVYGFDIERSKVTDTLLVTTKMVTDRPPTTADYYQLIDKLKQHIAAHGAQETNYPMLNITVIGSKYETMAAIPVNKTVAESGGIFFKRMIPGNILVTEVTGGMYTVNKALRQMEQYVLDQHLIPPAIPFQLLITNRLQEQDTSKWITKVYFPVI